MYCYNLFYEIRGLSGHIFAFFSSKNDCSAPSGRELDAMSDSGAVTFSIVSSELNVGGYAALSDMMGFVIDRATNKQCSVLYYLLLGYNQKKVAQMLSLEPPTVNQHVNAEGISD